MIKLSLLKKELTEAAKNELFNKIFD